MELVRTEVFHVLRHATVGFNTLNILLAVLLNGQQTGARLWSANMTDKQQWV